MGDIVSLVHTVGCWIACSIVIYYGKSPFWEVFSVHCVRAFMHTSRPLAPTPVPQHQLTCLCTFISPGPQHRPLDLKFAHSQGYTFAQKLGEPGKWTSFGSGE